MTNIVIVQGHPDAAGGHFCHALADSYRRGAEAAGHAVKTVTVAELDFPLLVTEQDFYENKPPDAIISAQTTLKWGQHWVLIYPLWLGDMPALLKAFLEQTLRPGFAHDSGGGDRLPTQLLKGRSGRIVVTMGMPGWVYRWFFGAHSLISLKRNILHFCGIRPTRTTLLGRVNNVSDERRHRWLKQMEQFGRRAR